MSNRVYLECNQGDYETIVPVLQRNKSKYWEPDKTITKWHRLDGPAVITTPRRYPFSRDVSWYFNDYLFDGSVIKRWCERNNADEEDLSEVEALIMWSELV